MSYCGMARLKVKLEIAREDEDEFWLYLDEDV